MENNIYSSYTDKELFNAWESINSDIEYNSDIVEQKNRGEYFRQSISFYTDDAYLWKTSSRPFTKLIIGYEVVGTDEKGEVFDNES